MKPPSGGWKPPPSRLGLPPSRIGNPPSKPGKPPPDDELLPAPLDAPAPEELAPAPELEPVPLEHAFDWHVSPSDWQFSQAPFPVPHAMSWLPAWQTPLLSQQPVAHVVAPHGPPTFAPLDEPLSPPSPPAPPVVEPPQAQAAARAGTRIARYTPLNGRMIVLPSCAEVMCGARA
jgi:hypothetical protein